MNYNHPVDCHFSLRPKPSIDLICILSWYFWIPTLHNFREWERPDIPKKQWQWFILCKNRISSWSPICYNAYSYVGLSIVNEYLRPLKMNACILLSGIYLATPFLVWKKAKYLKHKFIVYPSHSNQWGDLTLWVDWNSIAMYKFHKSGGWVLNSWSRHFLWHTFKSATDLPFSS